MRGTFLSRGFLSKRRQDGPADRIKADYSVQNKEPAREITAQFFKENISEEIPTQRLTIQGRYVYRVPEGLPNLNGLKVIHPGWWLGVMEKNRLEPSHALGMGLKSHQGLRNVVFPFNSSPVLAYLRGESLPNDGADGWTLVNIQEGLTGLSFPLGWGKVSQGILKNRYPRGLRWH